ncbi:MAG: ATP-binding protein [Desulfobacterales bacterium]|nr:ATP-binding protein [Desulfobacterales bacterium]
MEKPSHIETNSKNKVLMNVPPWIFIGAFILLFPLFAFITINNINRQKENSIRLLFEKGAALIRAFEAGTRTGMMMRGGNFQLQQLLTETAQQPDISYLLVTDKTGRILAHNIPSYIGKFHGTDLNLVEISNSSDVRWRQISVNTGEKVFETFSKFRPSLGPMNMRHRQMMRREWVQPENRDRDFDQTLEMIIFVGLDMSSVESARLSDARHTILMAVILLLVGLSGIILLFLTHSYRATRTSLYRIKAFSDNIVENIPIGILTTDPQKKIISINNAAENILCISGKEILGKDSKQALPDKLYVKMENLSDKEGFIEEEIDCTVRGRKIPIELNITILKDESDKFLGKVVLLKDLSEVSELRKEIARNQRLASVGRLAAGVAHEIRNPLSSIKGFATYFKERYGKNAEDENIANVMVQEVERLNRVVSQLLEFSKPIIITKKSVYLKPFIQDSLKMIERQAAENKIDIQTRYLDEKDKALFDPDRLSQVLLNLYLNALESMEKDGQLSVEVRKDKQQNGLFIVISDTGAGISEQDLANIFDPYFTTKPAGTGIGLALVHNVIEAHNGNIQVSSTPGKGTRMTVFLPDA